MEAVQFDLYLKKNLGSLDRTIRGILAGALIVWPPLAGWATWIIAPLAAFGGGLAVEAATGY